MRVMASLALAFLALCGCSEPEPEPSKDAGRDVVCGDQPRAALCVDQRYVDRCNQDGLLNAAMCYTDPGPDPLPSLSGQYPSYGCIAPAESNSGEGDAWTFWCCSKLTPGPVETDCGTCSNEGCLY